MPPGSFRVYSGTGDIGWLLAAYSCTAVQSWPDRFPRSVRVWPGGDGRPQKDSNLRSRLRRERQLRSLTKTMLISKQFRSAVGARAPCGVPGPGGGCEVQIQAGRRYRALGQAVLSCGSMPCSRSRARSRSISSASCWTRSARSGSAECPATHCSCRAALAASNSFSRLRRSAACS